MSKKVFSFQELRTKGIEGLLYLKTRLIENNLPVPPHIDALIDQHECFIEPVTQEELISFHILIERSIAFGDATMFFILYEEFKNEQKVNLNESYVNMIRGVK